MDFAEGTLHKPGQRTAEPAFFCQHQAGRLNDQATRSIITRIIDIPQAG